MIRVHLAVPLLAVQLAAADVAAEQTTRRQAPVFGYAWSGAGGDFDIPAGGDFATIPLGLSGSGGLRKWGNGELRLHGENTYTGGTHITNGIVRVGDGGVQGSIAGDILNDGLLEFDRADDVTFRGHIGGRGTVHYLGIGTMTLTADHTYTGITVLTGGRLRLGNGGTGGSLARDIYNDGAELVFDRRDTLRVPQGLHGYGRLVQAGTGTVVLSGPNSHRGRVEVRRGTLVLEGDQRRMTGRLAVLPGATLGGSGEVGSKVTVEDGGTLAAERPGHTLAMDSLTLRPRAMLRVTLDDAAAPRRPRLDVRHDLILDGSVHIAGRGEPGLHRLIGYGGTLTDRTLEIASVPPGTRREAWHVRTARAGRIDLLHDGDRPVRFWRAGTDGKGDGKDNRWRSNGGRAWSKDGTGADESWTAGALAVFGGRAGTVIVDDSAGAVRFSGAQFIADGYVIGGTGTLATDAAETVLRVGGDGEDEDGGGPGAGGSGSGGAGGSGGGHGGNTMRATIDADIAGSGGLVKTDPGTLVLHGNNRHTGGTTLRNGTLEIRDDRNLGAAHGPLTFDGGALRATADVTAARPVTMRPRGGSVDTGPHTVRWAGTYTGTGALAKTGRGTLELAGVNTATGEIAVAAGALRAAAANALGPSMRIAVAAGATLDTAGLPQTVAGLQNAGTVVLGPPPGVALAASPPANALVVRGDYIGRGGVVRLRTTLGDSDSPTDRLVIDGGRASGRTHLAIVNTGGLGARTLGDGIEVVRAVNGATTTAQTTRDAFDLQGGHVDAGAYEYRLYPGDANGRGESWYLRSTLPAVAPDHADDSAATLATAAGRTSYRPETALYAALPAMLAQGDLAMLGSLHRRQGDDMTAASPEPGAARRRAWGRVIDQGTRIRQQGTVAPRSDGWTSGAQLGSDLYAGIHHRVGLYGGTLGWRHRVHGDAGGVPDRYVGRLQGRSNYLGAYWTYTADTGWYADMVVQHGHQRGKGTAINGGRADIHARGTLVSLEAGTPLRLGSRWTAEPQAQIIAARRHIDDVDLPAATVRQHPGNSATGRLGLRVRGDYSGRHGQARPYARLDFLHGLAGTDAQSIKGPGGTARIGERRGYTSAELAAGGIWAINRHVGLYGEYGRLLPLAGRQRVGAGHAISAGMRIAW